MNYDFDRVIDRKNTNSSKWDLNEMLFGREEVLDMWVADMDFPVPSQVVEALHERVNHPIYGYSFPPDSLYEAIMDYAQRHHGWEIKREWIVFTSGVMGGVSAAIEAFSRPGDEVVVQPPVYHSFGRAIRSLGRHVVNNQLLLRDGRYEMDYDGLRELFSPVSGFGGRNPRIKLLVLCNPHNPVGRVWTPAELEQLGDICLENDCLLLSDEIHCDLMLEGYEHTVTATLSPELAKQTITSMSVSKTFNLAGLKTAFAVIPNDRIRREITRVGHGGGNLFGYAAMEAAYRYGDDWLREVLAYITANYEHFRDYIARHLPQLKVTPLEGTYLAWVDMSELGLSDRELERFLIDEAGLALEGGYIFGPGGEGYQRVNLAAPRALIDECLARLQEAIDRL